MRERGAFGGNSYNGSILIHTEDSGTRLAIREGFLEEVFMHEAAHASLDPDHGDAPGWRAAQQGERRGHLRLRARFPQPRRRRREHSSVLRGALQAGGG